MQNRRHRVHSNQACQVHTTSGRTPDISAFNGRYHDHGTYNAENETDPMRDAIDQFFRWRKPIRRMR